MRVIAIALWLAAIASTVHAQPSSLGPARQAFLEADFDLAQEAFEAALAAPETSRETLAEVHRYLSALALIAAHDDEARHHAAIAVALSPDVTPPPGAPSRMEGLLREVRAAGSAMALEIEIVPAPGGESARARAVLVAAPAGLVDALGLSCTGGEEALGPPPRLELSLASAQGRVACHATATTATGVELLTAHEELAPGALELGPPAAARSEIDDGVWIVLVALGTALVVGTVIGAVFAAQPGSPRIDGVTVVGF